MKYFELKAIRVIRVAEYLIIQMSSENLFLWLYFQYEKNMQSVALYLDKIIFLCNFRGNSLIIKRQLIKFISKLKRNRKEEEVIFFE